MAGRTLVVLAAVVWLGPTAVGSESAGGAARYAGVEVCISCHQRPELGNQALAWTGSAHARSSLVLETGAAEMIAPQAKGMVAVGHGRAIAEAARRLGTGTDCLQCHATGAADPPLWEPTFHVEDGVQCEACHGPRSLHVARMQAAAAATGGSSPQRPTPSDLERPDLERCMACHLTKPSHAVLQRPGFDPAVAWKRIAHPLPGR